MEEEVQSLMKDMQLKALHSKIAPLRTSGIPLTDKT